ILESFHDLRHSRLLLTDGHIDADDIFSLLIDDRVDGDRGLSGLAVADDQLALPAADGNHGVDRFQSGLQRLLDRLAIDHAWRDALDRVVLRRFDRTLSVDWDAQRVHYAADQIRPHRNRHDPSAAPHFVAFPDGLVFAQEHYADVVLFQVEGQSGDVVGKLDELTGHDPIETVHAGDSIAHGHHGPHFRNVDSLADPA